MKHKIRNENSGFTLIELIITIAVLAVISVPLLMYFTDSMRHSARMKAEQNAVVAAQNVLEELKVIDTDLDDINNLTMTNTLPPHATPRPTTSVVWEEVPGSSAAPGAASSYEVKGQYSLNNQVYTVKAKITPRSQLENDAGDTKVYQKAKAPRMNSGKDLIVTEKSTVTEEAKQHFYDEYTKYCTDHNVTPDPAITLDYMGDKLVRIIHLKAEPEKKEDGTLTNSGKILLSTVYEYKWDSSITFINGITGSTSYSETVKAAILDGTGEHNIFLMYTPIHYTSGASTTVINDTIVLEGSLTSLTNGTDADGNPIVLTGEKGIGDKKLCYRLYLVPDGEIDYSTSTYKTTLQTDSLAPCNFKDYIAEVYTSLKTGGLEHSGFVIDNVFPAAAGADNGIHLDNLVDSSEVNRVAEIEVSVYKGDSLSDSNRYTTVNGTKVQSQ